MSSRHTSVIEICCEPDEDPAIVFKTEFKEKFPKEARVLGVRNIEQRSVNGIPQVELSGHARPVGVALAVYHQEKTIAPWLANLCTPPLPMRVWRQPVERVA